MEMKISFYVNNNLHIEGTVKDNDERQELIKMIKYTILDLDTNKINESLNHIQDSNNIEKPQPTTELATEGQKRYMTKLGIEFTDDTTKVEAIDLINDYKIRHNIPIR